MRDGPAALRKVTSFIGLPISDETVECVPNFGTWSTIFRNRGEFSMMRGEAVNSPTSALPGASCFT